MARVKVRVKPGSAKNQIVRNPDGSLIVAVREPPVEGRANRAAAELLATFFRVPKSAVRLVAGTRSRQKVYEIGV
ncbi:MAG: DUF167 domain-containing protein [candidate division WOR-3 bacterium]